MLASKSSTFGASAVPAEPVPAGEVEDDLAEMLLIASTEGDTPCSGDVGAASSSVKAEEPSPAKKARTAGPVWRFAMLREEPPRGPGKKADWADLLSTPCPQMGSVQRPPSTRPPDQTK